MTTTNRNHGSGVRRRRPAKAKVSKRKTKDDVGPLPVGAPYRRYRVYFTDADDFEESREYPSIDVAAANSKQAIKRVKSSGRFASYFNNNGTVEVKRLRRELAWVEVDE